MKDEDQTSPELVEEYNPNDPFAEFTDNIDCSYPVIPAALYDLVIKKIEKGRNKENTGDKIAMELATTSSCTSVSGEAIAPGFIVQHNIGLTETPKYDLDRIRKAVASLAQAVGINVPVYKFLANVEMIKGKTVRCNVGIDKETDQYPARNKISRFMRV